MILSRHLPLKTLNGQSSVGSAVIRGVPSSGRSRQYGFRLALRVAFAIVLLPVIIFTVQVDLAAIRTMIALHYNDFGKFYYSTVAFLAGTDMYAPSPATHIPAPYPNWPEFLDLNPPHFHLLVLPLAGLPPGAAYLLWSIASVAALGVAAWIVFRTTPVTFPKSALAIVVLTIAFLLNNATVSMLVTGQLSWLMLLPMALVWRDMRSDRMTVTSGMALGVLAATKPFLGILVVYHLLRRRYRAVAAAAVGGTLAFTTGLLTFGWHVHRQWLDALHRVSWTWAAMNGSYHGLVSRVFQSSPYFTPVAVRSSALAGVLALGPLAIAGISVWSALHDEDGDRAWFVLTLAAVLASPLGWLYYLWFPLIAVPGLAARGYFGQRRLLWVFAGLTLFVPISVPLLGQPSAMLTATLGSIYFWGMTAAWYAAVRNRRRAPEASQVA